jgi:AhpD family alkylhydroperoxidase
MPHIDTSTSADAIRDSVRSAWGFVPNLIEEMLASPETARLYLEGSEILAEGALDEEQQNAVKLAVSAVNGCDYCLAAHTTVGGQLGTSSDDVAAIREGRLPSSPRLAPVVGATRLVMEQRGWLDADDQARLEADGIDRRRLFEIVSIVALKTISNYVNHIAGTEIDRQFGGA